MLTWYFEPHSSVWQLFKAWHCDLTWLPVYAGFQKELGPWPIEIFPMRSPWSCKPTWSAASYGKAAKVVHFWVKFDAGSTLWADISGRPSASSFRDNISAWQCFDWHRRQGLLKLSKPKWHNGDEYVHICLRMLLLATFQLRCHRSSYMLSSKNIVRSGLLSLPPESPHFIFTLSSNEVHKSRDYSSWTWLLLPRLWMPQKFFCDRPCFFHRIQDVQSPSHFGYSQKQNYWSGWTSMCCSAFALECSRQLPDIIPSNSLCSSAKPLIEGQQARVYFPNGLWFLCKTLFAACQTCFNESHICILYYISAICPNCLCHLGPPYSASQSNQHLHGSRLRLELLMDLCISRVRIYSGRLKVLQNVPYLPSLSALYLQDNCISTVAHLQSMPSLSILNLAFNPLDNLSVLTALAPCQALRRLDLHDCPIEAHLRQDLQICHAKPKYLINHLDPLCQPTLSLLQDIFHAPRLTLHKAEAGRR